MQNPAFRGVELTLCILKPHVIAAPHVFKDIQRKIIGGGFFIVQSKIANIRISEANVFYKEHAGKFFYNRLVTFMCSGPCGFQVLAKENAIEDWRKLLGPTKVYRAQFTHKDTIRGIHGLTDTRNAAHGSDSVISAAKEIQVFFPELNPTEWLSEWGERVRTGQLPGLSEQSSDSHLRGRQRISWNLQELDASKNISTAPQPSGEVKYR